MPEASVIQNPVLPVGGQLRHSTGIWGMWMLIGTEAALFAYLLFSYFYMASLHQGPWPPDGPPELTKSTINTVLLLASSLCAWWAEGGARHRQRGRIVAGLAAALLLGVAFLGIQISEWMHKPFRLDSDPYGSLYFTITGFHMMHVAVGLIMLAVLVLWAALGYFTERRHAALSVGVLYWHFVDAVWIAVYSALFLAPHLS
jgi:heme/copper-type cytochrome/quinol oxidase subunit 3